MSFWMTAGMEKPRIDRKMAAILKQTATMHAGFDLGGGRSLDSHGKVG